MSDKHASEKTPKVNYDEIAGRELDEASNALFDGSETTFQRRAQALRENTR